MLKFDLVQTDKHSTNDLLPPKNLQFLGAQIIYNHVGCNLR